MFLIRDIVALVLVMATGSAAAQQLTESEAVGRALAHGALLASQEGARETARSAVAKQFVWANPSLSYLQEPGGADDESTLTLSQSFELGGRGLRTAAARTRGEAVESDLALLRLDVARNARRAFYELLAAQRGVEVMERWAGRISRGSETVALLQKGGEVSGYDRRRAERERLSVDSRLRTARARLVGARERLAALLELDPDGLTASGELLPESAPDLSSLLQALEARPDIRAEALRAEAAGLERRAAQRWWLPSTELTAGTKTLGDSTDGTVLGIALSIPVFNRNQAAGLEATGDERATHARRKLLVARAVGEIRALSAEEQELRESAVAFRESAASSSDQLIEIATVAYRAGEVGILELLDAFRSAVDADAEMIDLELRTRLAAIELAHAAGSDASAIPVTENE